MFIADLSGISQPTASRIFRRMRPAIDQALAFTGISLEEAARDGRVILVDGTYVPTGNRPAQGQEVTKANYSGKRRCQCLSIQVQPPSPDSSSPHPPLSPEPGTTPPPSNSPDGQQSSPIPRG